VANSDIFVSVDDCCLASLLFCKAQSLSQFLRLSLLRRLLKPRWYKVAGSGQWPDRISFTWPCRYLTAEAGQPQQLNDKTPSLHQLLLVLAGRQLTSALDGDPEKTSSNLQPAPVSSFNVAISLTGFYKLNCHIPNLNVLHTYLHCWSEALLADSP
jgi:hypothetical protein